MSAEIEEKLQSMDLQEEDPSVRPPIHCLIPCLHISTIRYLTTISNLRLDYFHPLRAEGKKKHAPTRF